MAKKACKPTTNGNGALQNIFNECLESRVSSVEDTGSNRNFNYKNVNSATYTLTSDDYIIGVSYTATGAVTLTLPTISSVGKIIYKIKDEGYNANVANITINASGSDTIDDGVSTDIVIQKNGGAVEIYNNNIDSWFISGGA